MTAKEYLSQAWNIDRRINDKVAHVSQLRDMAMNVSAVISDMPRSPSPNNQRMENIIARLTDTEEDSRVHPSSHKFTKVHVAFIGLTVI